MRYKLALLCLTLVIASCTISKTATQTTEIPVTNLQNNIVFVVFKIRKGEINSTIEIVSNTKSSGKIKRQMETAPDSGNILTIEISDGNKIFQTVSMNHPLFKSVEFVESDGKFGKKDVALDKDTFFIRFQTKGASTTLKISETFTGGAAHEIANFKL
jgi:hypothetical protein